jgi:hypothetical protein
LRGVEGTGREGGRREERGREGRTDYGFRKREGRGGAAGQE